MMDSDLITYAKLSVKPLFALLRLHLQLSIKGNMLYIICKSAIFKTFNVKWLSFKKSKNPGLDLNTF